MKLCRRTVFKVTGAAVGSLLAKRVSAQQITEFSTLESQLIYEIEHGRVNPIHITEGLPSLPPMPPTETQADWGNIVIKWLLRHKMMIVSGEPEPVGESPQWINLWLFKPKASVSDIMTILDPPQYTGHGPKGNYTLRYPTGDDTYPRKEDTPLWQDYIQPSWQLVPGAQVTITAEMVETERASTTWPGARSLARWVYPGDDPVVHVEIPLRVAVSGLSKREALLALVEIKRYGRLRLLARPMLIKPTIHQGMCFIATAAYGSADSPQVDVLRRWRDTCLSRTRFGRAFIRLYYAVSPGIAHVVNRSKTLRSVVRRVLDRLVRSIAKRLP